MSRIAAMAAWIDRNRPLSFSFDGQGAIEGFAGDTLASALVANDVRLVGAVVQISPAARHPDRRAGGAERAGHDRNRRGTPSPMRGRPSCR